MPAGAAACAVRRSAVLVEPPRVLPEMSRMRAGRVSARPAAIPEP